MNPTIEALAARVAQPDPHSDARNGVGAPLTDGEVAAVEARLGHALPSFLRAMVKPDLADPHWRWPSSLLRSFTSAAACTYSRRACSADAVTRRAIESDRLSTRTPR